MISAATEHPDVFTSSEPLTDDNYRTIYPPRADAGGRFALSELMDWSDLMDQVYQNNVRVCAFLKHEIALISLDSAHRAAQCLRQIENTRPLFLLRHPNLIALQQRRKDICALLYGEAMVWLNYMDWIQMFAQQIAGSAEKWLPLSQALVENNLNGQKDWRQAESPAKWVKTTTNNIAEKESWTVQYAVNPIEGPPMVPLEVIAELPMEALLERKYTHQSVAQLEAAARKDRDVATYLACKLRNPTWSSEAIWLHLQWDELNGKRVDRRFRRLRSRIRELGLGMQCRDCGPPPGLVDASCTVYFEALFDGTRGKGTGVWQHRSKA